MKLAADAYNWKRWWSMRWIITATVFTSITAAYMALPPDWLPTISDEIKGWLALGSMFSAAGAGVSRVLHQELPCK